MHELARELDRTVDILKDLADGDITETNLASYEWMKNVRSRIYHAQGLLLAAYGRVENERRIRQLKRDIEIPIFKRGDE
jgi:hypothetical protein